MGRRRVAVLISGSGSNLQALIDYAALPASPAEIVLVLSNRADAYGLRRAGMSGIRGVVIDHRAYPDRASFEDAIHAQLIDAGVELVCLAGFMRILTAGFVVRWQDRMLNVHPSLLPSFRGLHTHQRALDTGVRVSGCTVHMVRAELDDGPIVVQGIVPVLAGDDAATLAARVLEVEHLCYPLALGLVASGEARMAEGRVVFSEGTELPVVLHRLLQTPA